MRSTNVYPIVSLTKEGELRAVQQESTSYGGGVWIFPGHTLGELNLYANQFQGWFISPEIWALEDREAQEFIGIFKVSGNFKRAQRRRKKGHGVNPNRNYQSVRIL